MTISSKPGSHLAPLAWRAMLEHSNAALLLIDRQDVVQTVSLAAAAIFGHPPEAICGIRLDQLLGAVVPSPTIAERIPIVSEIGELQGALLRLNPVVTAETATLEALQRQEHQLRQVLLAIGSELAIDSVLTRVMALSIAMLDADAGTLPLYDEQHDRLVPGHVINLPSDEVNTPTYRNTGLIWSLIDSGQPFIINDYPAQPRAMPSLVALGVQAIVAVPISAGGKIRGVLAVYHRRPQRRFSQRDLELLTIIAQQTGIALQNARLYQATLAESERRRVLYSASMHIGAALNLEALYHSVHHAISQLFPVDTLAIGLLDAEQQALEYRYIWDHGRRRPHDVARVHQGLLGFVVGHEASLRIDPLDQVAADMFRSERFGLSEQPSRSFMATVLRIGDLVIGGIAVQAAQQGAYSNVDLDALEMLAATTAIALQNARLFQQIQQIATLDPLTAIANRRHFFEMASREVERSNRYNHPLSMIMFDADHFKTINDRYGHLIGDQVLQTIAMRCQDSLREVDLIARYGGEEFVVLLPETDAVQALIVAERLRDCICLQPFSTDVAALDVSISVGVASTTPGTSIALEELLDVADRALYQAKSAGRNQVRSDTDLAEVP
ncbi:MAG: diguanylate cyclase [Oscillochloris sp.]|nr:diguanylate cyclase [Oscillochloris sp.]